VPTDERSRETQGHLFGDEPEWELDDAGEGLVATVIIPSRPLKPLDYLVPDALAGEVEVGRRLNVPLGRGDRLMAAYCVEVGSRPLGTRRLKEVAAVLDSRRLLSPAMMRLTRWIAERYLCELGQVLEAVIPAGVRGQAGTRLTTFLSVAPDAAQKLKTLKLPTKQSQALRYLAESPEPLTPAQLALAVRCTQSPITALRRRGLITAETRRSAAAECAEPAVEPEPAPEPNRDQRQALDAILETVESGRHATHLLFGVTGSGKTEVYMRAVSRVVEFGRQAIVLVPEISLTPQAQQRFRSRFGSVAVLHSHQTDSERHWQWERIAAGQVSVVVGARSAVFAPTPHLGLIVMDEEHESSFKQSTAPRYHARDVALERAKAEGVPLVLGSATPSLESWVQAESGEYHLIEMPRRVMDRPMPSVETIDLRMEQHGRAYRGAISRRLAMAMGESLKRGEQVILLLNRRGFSTHIQCPACGVVVRCPECEIALTHHRHGHMALCHYCEYEVPAPKKCPECGFAGINYGGLGTQRLEAEVRSRFPDARAIRMDTDAMQGPHSHERALAEFRSGDARILLGTQMIAKGLDFPNVTLVGVVNADTALHLPDFRAAERTFQLLVQVAGRSGRGEKGGRVLVQTLSPDHPAILAAARHDYRRFVAAELPTRNTLGYPPFASMIRLVIRGEREAVAAEFADGIAERIKAARTARGLTASTVRVLGPAVAPMAKLRGRWRFQIQVQGADAVVLRELVRGATADLEPPDDVQWIADVDPLEML